MTFAGCGVGGVNWCGESDWCDGALGCSGDCCIVGVGGGLVVVKAVVALDVVVLSSAACVIRPWPSGVGC